MPRTRTGALSMSRAECANNQEGYYCCDRDGDCVLREDKRCDYFERCVLPLAGKPVPHQKEYAKVRDRYRKLHQISFDADERRCPDCGGALARRKRLCEKCAKNRRLETKKLSWYKQAGRLLDT